MENIIKLDRMESRKSDTTPPAYHHTLYEDAKVIEEEDRDPYINDENKDIIGILIYL